MTVDVMKDQFPIRKDSIEELVGHRNRAIELCAQAYSMLAEANLCSEKAAPFAIGGGLGTRHEIHGRTAYNADECMKLVREHVDRTAWQSLLTHSGLRNLMDATAHQQFNKSLEKDPPLFTVENITTTFMAAAAEAPQILERSVLTVFDKITPRRRTHMTNTTFGIGMKIILTGAVGAYGWNSYGYTREMVSDMDRLFHVLDGKKPPEAGNIADLINSGKGLPRIVESEYFRCKLFKNGNLHMEFRNADLVKRVNAILIKHKGTTLPDDRWYR